MDNKNTNYCFASKSSFLRIENCKIVRALKMSQGRRFVRHKAVQLPHLSTASLNGLNISLGMLNSTQSGTLSLVNTHRLGKNEKKRMSYLEQHERCTADSSKVKVMSAWTALV